jgi:hypothetical protein
MSAPLVVIWTPEDVRAAAELAALFPSEPHVAPVVDLFLREVIA